MERRKIIQPPASVILQPRETIPTCRFGDLAAREIIEPAAFASVHDAERARVRSWDGGNLRGKVALFNCGCGQRQ
jgi:hypothetical protein